MLSQWCGHSKGQLRSTVSTFRLALLWLGHTKVNGDVFLTYLLWVPLVILIAPCFRADSYSQIFDTTLQGFLENISKCSHSKSTTLSKKKKNGRVLDLGCFSRYCGCLLCLLLHSALVRRQMGLAMQANKGPALSIHWFRVKTSGVINWSGSDKVTCLFHISLSECLLVCIWWISGPTFVELPAPEELKDSPFFCVSKSTPERWKKRSRYF